MMKILPIILTREAIELYLSKLGEGGVLAFHISNHYLDLRPVLGELAYQLGLLCLAQDDRRVSQAEAIAGKSPSVWLLMARDLKDLKALASDPRWESIARKSMNQASFRLVADSTI